MLRVKCGGRVDRLLTLARIRHIRRIELGDWVSALVGFMLRLKRDHAVTQKVNKEAFDALLELFERADQNGAPLAKVISIMHFLDDSVDYGDIEPMVNWLYRREYLTEKDFTELILMGCPTCSRIKKD